MSDRPQAMSADELARVLELRERGLSIAAIAAETGRSKSSIHAAVTACPKRLRAVQRRVP